MQTTQIMAAMQAMLGDMSNPVWVVIVFIVIPPIVMWLKRKIRPTRRPVNVVVDCPHCGAVNGLERFRNYICADCHGTVALTKGRESSEPSDEWDTYVCRGCGAENISPLRQCLYCNTPRDQ